MIGLQGYVECQDLLREVVVNWFSMLGLTAFVKKIVMVSRSVSTRYFG